MMRPDTSLSCSVKLIEKPVNEQYQYGYELEEIQLEDTPAPENSIDSPIICRTHKSILNVNFNTFVTVNINDPKIENTNGLLIGYIYNQGTQNERLDNGTTYNDDFKSQMKKVLVYNGNVLKYFKFINQGSYGAVYIASNKPLDSGEQMYAVAIKIYTRTSSTKARKPGTWADSIKNVDSVR